MRFPPQFLDDIRARLPVSEVVGRRVKLKKAGREFKGLSPFNREKSPSFTVNDQKGFFHDFSSGKHGDIFGFVMETEGLTFPEAVERLAGMAGLPMPVVSRDAVEREERRRTLYDVLELAAKFFETTLASRAGAHARGYLADRGLEPATQLQFRIGYVPGERFALKEHLGGQGIPVEDMVAAGLLIAADDIPVPYDRFRDRVMFPIADLRGRVIAFGGRALQKDAQAKYLNSPETPLFHKGATLYNIAAARAAAHQGATVVVAEGYVDVIALVRAGFPAAVAPLGTALTEDQLALLWKMADEPILCFDGDDAGRRAAYRAVDLALPQLKPGKSLRFAMLPQGQDPDDLARAGGAAAVAEVLGSTQPLADVFWARETEDGNFDTPERRAALEAHLAAATRSIQDETVRRYYQQDIRGRVQRLFASAGPGPGRAGNYQGARGPGGRRQPYSGPAQQRRPFQPGGGWQAAPWDVLPASSPRINASSIVRGHRSVLPAREALILLAVINHPWLLESHDEELADLEFRHPDADRVRRAILDAVAGHAHAPVEPALLREAISAAGLGPLLARVESAITHTSDWPARPDAGRDDVGYWWNHVITLHRKQRTLNKELKDAERALGTEPSEENLHWLKDVQERLSALEGAEALIEDFGVSSGRPVRSF
jgi:DNA primase